MYTNIVFVIYLFAGTFDGKFHTSYKAAFYNVYDIGSNACTIINVFIN